ncbi:MAG: carboxypeptidase M32 [Thermoplasmatota archaeon]
MIGKEYEDLRELYEEITRLEQISCLLVWDQNVYMPDGSIASRAAQTSLVTGLIHQRYTSKRMGELLAKLDRKDLDDDQSVVVREISREYRRKTAVPEKLAKEISRTESEGYQIWVKAKQNDDFGSFASTFEKMVDLKKEVAEHIGYDDVPYDALLDGYEPYMRSKEVVSIFSDLRTRLVPLAERIADSGITIDASPITGRFPKDKQIDLSNRILEDMGYDFNRGRLDETEHPFTIGSMDDTRITTRINEDDIRTGLYACIHEGGHALYEMGYPEKNYCTPLAEPVSLGIHESQSRFWENMVGRSLGFWERYLPEAKSMFPSLRGSSPIDLFKAANSVAPSLIRVEADEVTYNLHILIRFEIESEIFQDRLEVNEVPQAWNDKYSKYLGIEPENDSMGCLQDVHWSIGYFGYFPTYTLGNLYSAMIREAMVTDLGDLDDLVRKGEMKKILAWLRERVHRHGKRYPAKELIRKVSGQELSALPFIGYLKEKYSRVYDISL